MNAIMTDLNDPDPCVGHFSSVLECFLLILQVQKRGVIDVWRGGWAARVIPARLPQFLTYRTPFELPFWPLL